MPTTDMSVIHLVSNASTLVQLVMLLLLCISLLSWAVIFQKWFSLKKARHLADRFEERIWASENLTRLYESIHHARLDRVGMEKIFETGYHEFRRMSQTAKAEPDAVVDGSQRAMRIVLNKEIDSLESNLSFLATVGSTSPYIGLFGTVWGIMNSFRALGNVQQATISMVAPGISEALIATAMGLLAAIPAVMAYNRFANEVERLSNRYSTFLEEVSSVLHRHSHS